MMHSGKPQSYDCKLRCVAVMQYGSLVDLESDQLLSERQSENGADDINTAKICLRFLFALVLSASLIAFINSMLEGSVSDHFSEQSRDVMMPATKKSVTETITIIASNEYGKFEGPYPWLQTIPGTQLVEPYKNTILEVHGTTLDQKDLYYNWTFPGKSFFDRLGEVHTKQISVLLKEVGSYHISVEVIDKEDKIIAQFNTLIVCKFVKREIRSLTVADRDRFLDAAFALWNYTQEDGTQKFGPKFTSIVNFVALHSEASNDNMCDQFHEGTGFLTHHLALTNSFEAAIRSVDPSVTLPYWDFTIEGQAISDKGESPSYMKEMTPVFSPEWFGSVDINNNIADSRWAHTLMPRQKSTSGDKNSYGYIRSYWNNNPSPEVTRHLFDVCGFEAVQKKVPSCGRHYEILNSATLGQFLTKSPADGHGPMHVGIGGMWGGCTQAYAKLIDKWGQFLDQDMTEGELSGLGLTNSWNWGTKSPRRLMVETVVIGEYFHIYRSLWRSHMCAVDGTPKLLVCPEHCDSDTPFEECSCQVDKLVNGETTWQNLLPCVVGNDLSRFEFKVTMPDAFLEDLVTMIATAPVLEGEMIESSSPADILFWLTHPVIERLLAAKRLSTVSTMNGFPIMKWPQVDGNNESWVDYSFYDFKLGTNPWFKDQGNVCFGHAAHDIITPVTSLTHTIEHYADTNKDGFLSNWEFYLALDPNIMGNMEFRPESENLFLTIRPSQLITRETSSSFPMIYCHFVN